MADNRVAEAIDIVARRIVFDRVTAFLDEGQFMDSWAEYPEIGEQDFEEVTKRATALVVRLAPDDAEYDGAYKFLTSRATWRRS